MFISEVVWGATLVNLFKKFGWVLALVAVLLLVVVAVFVIIDKSYNTVDDNFPPKSSKIEKLDETQEKILPNEYEQEKNVRDHVKKNSEGAFIFLRFKIMFIKSESCFNLLQKAQ